MNWLDICALDEINPLGSRVVAGPKGDIAIFRAADDQVFALDDRCPHKGGPLSQGLIYGKRVACPLHNWQIELESGEAVAPDQGCAHRHPVRVENGRVLLGLDSVALCALSLADNRSRACRQIPRCAPPLRPAATAAWVVAS